MFEDMNVFMTRHQIHPVVSRIVGFDAVTEGLDHIRRGAHLGKVVVDLQ